METQMIEIVTIDRKRDTILAALRCYQNNGLGRYDEIAGQHGLPLDLEEIDELCEEINSR